VFLLDYVFLRLQSPSNPDAVEQVVWLTSSGTCAIACWLTFPLVPCCNISWKLKSSVVSYLIAYLLTVYIVPGQGIRADRLDDHPPSDASSYISILTICLFGWHCVL